MSDKMGGNSQAQLRGYYERIEHVNAQIDDLKLDKAAIFAEAKATGFNPKRMRKTLSRRKLKPHDRQEADTEQSLYDNVGGVGDEPPLFRQLGAIAGDAASTDKLIDLFKKIVPPNGDLIATVGGKQMRFWRDQQGNPHVEPYQPAQPGGGGAGASPSEDNDGAPASAPQKRPKPEVPEVDDEGAKALGRRYAKDNRPVTDNPFPFGDKRRPLFDQAWRDETGNDGMGD